MLVAPSPIPRFSVRVDTPAEVLVARAARRRPAVSEGVEIHLAGRHVELYPAEDRRHFWSPWLSVTVEQVEDGALIRGRFGPHPAVWTLFVGIQAFLLFTFVFALLLVASEAILRRLEAWPILVAFGALAGMVGMYLGSLVGQRLGHDQMEALHRALDDLLEVETFEAAPYESLRARRDA